MLKAPSCWLSNSPLQKQGSQQLPHNTRARRIPLVLPMSDTAQSAKQAIGLLASDLWYSKEFLSGEDPNIACRYSTAEIRKICAAK